MSERKQYEMTATDLEKIMDACKPVPLIMLQCRGTPTSAQSNANSAWEELGYRMGFDFMTVKPFGNDPKTFTAQPKD